MEITDKTIKMTPQELENELDSGSDLAKEILSSMTTSFRPSFLDAGANGQDGQFLVELGCDF